MESFETIHGSGVLLSRCLLTNACKERGEGGLRAEEVGVVHDLYFCGAHYGQVSALTFIN